MNRSEFLAAARRREKLRTVFYRALAAEAELSGELETSERLNGLHADEQHHLSRLTARALELGERLEDFADLPRPDVTLAGWEASARLAEQEEVDFYSGADDLELDDQTRAIVREIHETECLHLEHLGGKWMPA